MKSPPKFYSAVKFAEALAVNRTTVLAWLRKGIVPGAVREEIVPGFIQWRIPAEALKMERIPQGWPKGRSRKGQGAGTPKKGDKAK